MQQQNIGSQIKSFFQSKGLLSSIIIANVVVWLFMLCFNLVDYLFELRMGAASNVWNDWFALSSKPVKLLRHPWTVVTYAFLHADFWHLLWNMLMLYVAGTMCCRYLGIRRFGWIYFLSGIFGGLLYVGAYNLFPVFRHSPSVLVGASAAVLGVFMAVATYVPHQQVYIWPFRRLGIKMIYLAVIFIAIDLLAIPRGNAGGHIAHLGGALFGFLFIWIGRNANSDAIRRWLTERRNKIRMTSQSKKKNASRDSRPMSDDEFNRRRADEQKRVDAILDKISKSGYDSLSKEEKTFLFNYK